MSIHQIKDDAFRAGIKCGHLLGYGQLATKQAASEIGRRATSYTEGFGALRVRMAARAEFVRGGMEAYGEAVKDGIGLWATK